MCLTLMSEERPQWDLKRVDYRCLHSSGWTEEGETEPDLDLDLQQDGKEHFCSGVGDHQALVRETPCLTPVEGLLSDMDRVVIVPETQVPSPESGDLPIRSRSESTDNMADNLLNELSEAEIREKEEAAEAEQVELEKRAAMLTKQVELEAKERQLVYLRKQITRLSEACKAANERDVVFNPEVLGDDPTAQNLLKVMQMLQKEDEERERRTTRRKT